MEIFGSYCEYCCNGVVILWYFFIEGKHVQCSFFFFRFVLKYPYPFPNYGPGVSVSMISYPFLAGPYPYPYPQVPHPYVLASWPDLSLTTYCTAHRLKYVDLAESYTDHRRTTLAKQSKFCTLRIEWSSPEKMDWWFVQDTGQTFFKIKKWNWSGESFILFTLYVYM